MTKITEPCKQSATMEPSSNNIPFIQLQPPARTLFEDPIFSKDCPSSTHVPNLSQDPAHAKTLLSCPSSHTLPIPHIHNVLRNCPPPTYLDSHCKHPEHHQTTAIIPRKRSPLTAKFTPCTRLELSGRFLISDLSPYQENPVVSYSNLIRAPMGW